MQIPLGNTLASGPSAGGNIVGVEPGSLGELAGLRTGDILVAINGRPLQDVLDYQYYATDERLALRLRRGEQDLLIHVEGGRALGIRFAETTFDGIRRCNNRCPFCFVRQLPKGVRRSLYIKDDDYRFSVSYGSFVTLTNLTEEDWQRLAEQRLSPLRISVHTTDPELRRQLLGNPKAPDVMEQLRRAAALGLHAHTQLVLCPGVNDGAYLARSISDLAAMYPTVQSIAVVPVGLTRYNRDPALRLYAAEEAAAIVSTVITRQRELRHRFGRGLVYLGDEFYFLAGRPFPAGRKYDGYPQYENGVGLVRALLDEWARLRRQGPARGLPSLSLTLVSGRRIAPLLTGIAAGLSAASPLKLEVVPVANEFFGRTVTVSGLLAGVDVVDTLAGRPLGDAVILPRTTLDAAGTRFLDDCTPSDVEAALGRPVRFARTLRELLACAESLAAGEASTRPTSGSCGRLNHARLLGV